MEEREIEEEIIEGISDAMYRFLDGRPEGIAIIQLAIKTAVKKELDNHKTEIFEILGGDKVDRIHSEKY